MQVFLVLGFGLVFGGWWLLGNRYQKGDGPLDRLPPGVAQKPSAMRIETVADGTRYRVYDFSALAGRSFHVAEVKGKPEWISFWRDDATGKRTLYASLAPSADLIDLRKDWAL